MAAQAGNISKPDIAAAFRAAFPVTVPVMMGYIFLGSGYGVLMNELGYGPAWTVAMSVLVFGGTIQYVATTLLVAGFDPLYALSISAIINARHLFYGFSMLSAYSGMGWKKPFLVFWLTDETFSLLCSGEIPDGVDAGWYRFFVSALDYLYWLTGSLVGALARTFLDFNAKGIEFVMTALFTVIVVNQWRTARTHAPAVIGLAASALCLVCFGPRYFIVPAMLLIVAALMSSRNRLEDEVRREEEDACHDASA